MGAAPPWSSASTTLTSPASSFPSPSPSPDPLPTSLSSLLPAEATGSASAAFICHLLCPWRTRTVTVTQTQAQTQPALTTSVTVTATTTLTPSCSLPASSLTSSSLPATLPTSSSLPSSSLPASSSSSSPPTSSEPPGPHPTLECSIEGYFIQDKKLLKINLSTGAHQVLAFNVGGSGGDINALGYNTLDNYLYGLQGAALVRISADGFVETVATLPGGGSGPGANMGDVDGDGIYHFGASGAAWGQVDLVPGSDTYGKLVANGTADTRSLLSLSDWTSTPYEPGFLYSLALDDGVPTLARWSTSTHEWEVVYDHYIRAGPPFVAFGAIMASSDGALYASENAVGVIVRIKLSDPEDIAAVAGPTATSNSGARCALLPA
ncbi:hypothetical protein CDD81_2131 [Ophiocordyceps australis]|uniref:DUF6923 domain-containing protein n=1 Tax=Ophiocordyceps australis TaxID=1399860 RepID=A0A2C5XUF9_9HYPO|nr:hypothetical protein CDD81_2131 [Ophiocordyceps australis]